MFLKNDKKGYFLLRILMWKRKNEPGNTRYQDFLGFSILPYVGVFCVGVLSIGVYFLSFSFISRWGIVVYLKSGSRLTFWRTYPYSYCFHLKHRFVPTIGFSADISIDMFIDICSDICSGIFIGIWLTFCCNCHWHFDWHVYWHVYWHFYWHFYSYFGWQGGGRRRRRRRRRSSGLFLKI